MMPLCASRFFRHASWAEQVLFLSFTFLIACSGVAGVLNVDSNSFFCEHYDSGKCEGSECKPIRKQCINSSIDVRNGDGHYYCFALWGNNTNKPGSAEVTMKGCWYNVDDCDFKKTCVASSLKDELLFCCCDSDDCNTEVSADPTIWLKEKPPSTAKPPLRVHTEGGHLMTTFTALGPLFAGAILVTIGFAVWRRHKFADHQALPMHDTCVPPTLPQHVQLLEVKANGRYGSVWKAQFMNKLVAAKIFPQQEQRSWRQEVDIYNLPRLNLNDNVLRFFGAERVEIDGTFRLVTEFHEHGSLYDFLKGNLVNYADALKMCRTMTKGLAFLHEELPPTKVVCLKPAIAHRDFKSKNVLVKMDLTTCIADFGLAMKFEPGRNPGEAHGQVGTRRYMAPEVLDGAISFNRDAFLRIDMYACGLVLWEIMSRCSAADGPVEDYMLPFEEEVGLHPTLEDMQEAVVHKKQRPVFKDNWLKHQGLAELTETIQECWDQDAEARLSASCVEERLSAVTKLTLLLDNKRAPSSPILSRDSQNLSLMPQDSLVLQGRPLLQDNTSGFQQGPLSAIDVRYAGSRTSFDCYSSNSTTATTLGSTSLSSSPSGGVPT